MGRSRVSLLVGRVLATDSCKVCRGPADVPIQRSMSAVALTRGSGTPVTVRTLAAPLRYGLIQTEAWVGSTARVTTFSRSARIASISTASRSRAVKAATVASAS